ncbi:MAG: hypothetical protein JRH11_01840 [Deltaproteobacteria bacterium]|nr:hypothetical protein [Deltaproteobacteria bacterium]
MPIQPLDHLKESLGTFRAQPVSMAVLGLSLVLSAFLLPCGLGLVALPWFGSELYAFQVATQAGGKVRRNRAWLSAGVFILGAAILVIVAAVLASLGAHLRGEDAFTDARRVGLTAGGVALAAFFIMPFTYAPRILVDRGGSMGGAALESVRFFMQDGALGHVAMVFLAHAIQSSPLAIATVVGLLFADASLVPFLLLGAVPFLAVTVPVGQGVITAAWVARRHRLTDASRRRPAGRPPASVIAALALSWIAPGIGVSLVIASLVHPSPLLRIGEADSMATDPLRVLVDAQVEGRVRTLVIPDTALTVEVDGADVRVVASDGGGAGELPISSNSEARETDREVHRVRIAGRRDLYLIDISTAAGWYRATIDRAGVRQGDDLGLRLAARVTPWGLLVLALALLLVPLVLTGGIAALAQLRASSARSPEDVPDLGLSARRARVLRSVALMTLGLAPLSLGALAVGLIALL